MKNRSLPFRFLVIALLSVFVGAHAPAAAEENGPIQIGYSFNEGTRAGTVPTDYYGNLDGAWTGTWVADGNAAAYFVEGHSGEEGDYAIVTAAGNRVRTHISEAVGPVWGAFTLEIHLTGGVADSFRRAIHMVTFGEGSGTHGDHYATVLQKNSINQLRASLGTSFVQTAFGLEQDRWYHAAVVFDPDENEIRFYVDGTLIGSDEPLAWPDDPPSLYIGASNTGGSPWNGKIDNFRFTQAVLDPSEFLLDGFGAEHTQPPPPPPPVEGAEEWQFFWTELNLGEIHTARGDGSHRSTLLTDLNRPIGIAADMENGFLYWAEDGVAGNTTNDGRIGRANLDGSDQVILYAAENGDPGLDNPQFIALHIEAGRIYWADHTTGIYRAPLDGSGPVETVYQSTLERYTNLALDRINNYVYFGNPQSGELFRTGLDGENFEWMAFGLTGTWAFNGLDIDPTIERIYFPDTTSIKSAGVFGTDIQTLATGLGTPLGVVLSPDRSRVFYTERGGRRIGTVLTDGSGQQPLLIDMDSPFGLTVVLAPLPDSTPFDEWRQAHFTSEELEDDAISGPEATPAGDGIANLLKHALGLGDPKTASRSALPVPELTDGEWRLTYSRSKAATDVDLTVHVSTDLLDWHSGSEYTEIVAIDDTQDPEQVTVRILPPAGESDKLFLRLIATEIPE